MEYRRKNKSGPVGRLMRWVFLACGVAVAVMVLVFTIALVAEGLGGIQKLGVRALLGTVWAPQAPGAQYGVLPLVLSTVYIAGAATLLAAPLGILCALFLSRFAPPALRDIMWQVVSLMGNIPSVVYGLLGVAWLLPWLQNSVGLAHGESLLAAILTMAVMFVPRVASMALLNFAMVPPEVEHAALALGATPTETWVMVSLRYAKYDLAITVAMHTGIVAGETLSVMMVAGNVANMPTLTASVQTLATAIGSEAFSTGGEQWHLLFSLALMMFCGSALLFGVVRFISCRKKRNGL